MSIIKDIAGYAGSKIRKEKVNRQFASTIVNKKIGPGSTIGQESYDTYYSRIKGLADQNKQEEAIKYAEEEGVKVANDKGPNRKWTRNKWPWQK